MRSLSAGIFRGLRRACLAIASDEGRHGAPRPTLPTPVAPRPMEPGSCQATAGGLRRGTALRDALRGFSGARDRADTPQGRRARQGGGDGARQPGPTGCRRSGGVRALRSGAGGARGLQAPRSGGGGAYDAGRPEEYEREPGPEGMRPESESLTPTRSAGSMSWATGIRLA